MGILDTLKDVAVLIQRADNIDLVKQMLALQTQVQDLVDENRALKARLTTRDQLTFRNNAYWINDEGPFCSACWDTHDRLVRLHTVIGYTPRCPSCNGYARDASQPPPKPKCRTNPWIPPK